MEKFSPSCFIEELIDRWFRDRPRYCMW